MLVWGWVGRCRGGAAALGLLAALFWFSGPAVVQAAAAVGPTTLYVSATGNDSGDCSSSSSPCATITYALTQAAADSDDTIEVTGDISDTVTINSNGGSLTIIGEGSDTTVTGDGQVAVFTVQTGASVTFQNLTITGGGEYNGAVGGAIDNFGTVTVTGSTLTRNAGEGGAILNEFGDSLTVEGSTISDNTSGENSGGIYDTGAYMVVDHSMISGNSGFTVGGIEASADPNDFPDATARISDSTVSGNTGTYGGGVLDDEGPLQVVDTTVTGNTAGVEGGGISMEGDQLELSVSSSTITGNQAPSGAGLYLQADGTSYSSVVSSTISGNTGDNIDLFSTPTTPNTFAADLIANPGNGGADCVGDAPVDAGYDVADDSSCDFTGEGSVQNPAASRIAPLANNGGPTQTMALEAGNPAVALIPDPTAATINGSSVQLCPTTDQRGIPSPAGNPCDAGAVQLAGQTVTFTSTPTSTAVGATYTPTATSPSGELPTFAVDGSSTPAACTISGGTVTFTGPGTCVVDASVGGDGGINWLPGGGSQRVTVLAATQPGFPDTGAPSSSQHPTEIHVALYAVTDATERHSSRHRLAL